MVFINLKDDTRIHYVSQGSGEKKCCLSTAIWLITCGGKARWPICRPILRVWRWICRVMVPRRKPVFGTPLNILPVWLMNSPVCWVGVSGCTFKYLSNCGHSPMLETFDEYFWEVFGFLQK